ncbi:MAG: histidine kinase [Niabella sp.]|nr:histidine kinase [Niabella sp.]
MSAYRICTFIAVFLFPFLSHSQEYYFRHIQVENGLSNNTATCLIQDKSGFIWIGTKDGLDRFDGYNFKVFRNQPDDSTSLGNNSIWKLHEARNGMIWVGTEFGIYRFDPATGKFSFLKNTPKTLVRAIAEDDYGNIWMILGMGLYRYQPQTQQVQHYSGPAPEQYSTLTVCKNNQLWVATQFGQVGVYEAAGDHFTFHSVFSHSKPAVSNWIERLYDAGNGSLLIGTSSQGVKLFDTRNHTYKDLLRYNEDKTEIFARDFIQSAPDEYWIATEKGLYIYNTVRDSFTHLQKNYHAPYSINDNALYSFCRDREGGIWIGTYFGGINYFPKSKPLFEKFLPGVSPQSIQGNAVRVITADAAGHVWIGTEDAGLNKFDPQTGVFKNFIPDGTGKGIAYTNIHGLLYEGNRLWIGTFEHGLDIMDLKTETIVRRFTVGPGSGALRSNFIHSIYQTKNGQIWIGTSNGIYFYDPVKSFIAPGYFPKSSFYSSILETSDGTIWAGTFQDGLRFYNPKQNICGQLRLLRRQRNLLAENRITFLRESKRGGLWVATENGLFYLNLNDKSTTGYSITNGLPSNLIYTVTEDDQDRIWVTTSKGLALIEKDLKTIRTFTQSTGLPGEQFNYSSVFKAADGSMYMGTVKGLIRFQPDQVRDDNYVPPLYITNFSVFNTPLNIDPNGGPLKKSLQITDTLRLPYNASTFNIDFAAINYTSPDNVKYAYKLVGLDKNWNYIKTNRSVYFTNLPHGTYLFKVRSTNSSDVWQPNERTLTIIITPPLWETTGAYLLYTLLLLLLLSGAIVFYRNYMHHKQLRKMQLYAIQKEKELIESKIDFFTKVAHEIRTPLTLIKAPLEKITKLITKTPQTEKYLTSMNRNTERLLELTNQLLDFRKIESQQLSLNFIETSVPQLITDIWNRFQATAENKNIEFSLKVPEGSFTAFIDKDAFTKIVSNLLDNAIKYGSSLVRTELSEPDRSGHFELRVSNDGTPIAPEEQQQIFELFFRSKLTEAISGTGIGLALAQSLTHLHQGRLSLASSENLISFELRIPTQPGSFKQEL